MKSSFDMMPFLSAIFVILQIEQGYTWIILVLVYVGSDYYV